MMKEMSFCNNRVIKIENNTTYDNMANISYGNATPQVDPSPFLTAKISLILFFPMSFMPMDRMVLILLVPTSEPPLWLFQKRQGHRNIALLHFSLCILLIVTDTVLLDYTGVHYFFCVSLLHIQMAFLIANC